MLAELHAGVQSLNIEVAVKSKFTIHNVNNEVSLSLCKYQPWCKNICIQNTCLGSQFWKLYVYSLSCSSAHFAVFPFLSRVFSCIGNFAHHCVVLLNAPLSDRDKKKKKKKKTCLQWVSFPGKSLSIVSDARRSRCPIGLRFQEVRSPGVGQVVCEPLWAKISHLSLGGIQPLWVNLWGV